MLLLSIFRIIPPPVPSTGCEALHAEQTSGYSSSAALLREQSDLNNPSNNLLWRWDLNVKIQAIGKYQHGKSVANTAPVVGLITMLYGSIYI